MWGVLQEGRFCLDCNASRYKAMKRQGRADILRHVWPPKGAGGHGDIWIDPETGEDLDYCPFLQRVVQRKYICSIHETRPKLCREFWCDYAYGVERRGQTFRGMAGWTGRAKQSGYGQGKVLTLNS